MVQKVNGFVSTPGSFLTAGVFLFTISTVVDIKTRTDADGVDGGSVGTSDDVTMNAALDQLVNTISMFAQPVILGDVKGTGPYTLTFGVEHADVFGANGANLQTAIQAITGGAFAAATVAPFTL